MNTKTKRIYIILTHTGTVLSRIIKKFTKDEFSHISIALDKELKEMYSFGRLNPYNPFWAGFVHESIKSGTFKRFKRTETKIYSLEITEEEYNKIKKIIYDMKNRKERLKFNIIGLFAVGFNKKIKFKNSFYCAEFVKYVLEESGVKNNLPELIRPENFKKLKNIELIYKGRLNEYPIVDVIST